MSPPGTHFLDITVGGLSKKVRSKMMFIVENAKILSFKSPFSRVAQIVESGKKCS